MLFVTHREGIDSLHTIMQVLHGIVLIILFLPNVSKCDVYYIKTSTSIEESDGCSNNISNLTLTQFANCSQFIDANATLIFSTGRHYLNVDLIVYNISEFSLLGNMNTDVLSANVTIHCQLRAKFNFEYIDMVYVERLSFLGCETTFRRVHHLQLDNAMFYGTEYSSTALVLNYVAFANIVRSNFVSHRIGSLHYFEYNGNLTRIGGAVIVNMTSNVSISRCVFQNNKANFGGAIYIERNSSVSLNSCLFTQNSAILNGGVIYANTSTVNINESTFFDNEEASGSQAIVLFDTKGNISNTHFSNNSGAIQVLRNEVLIENCTFVSNKVEANTIIRAEGTEFNYKAVILAALCSFHMFNCTFYSNEVIRGGAILELSYTDFVTDGKTVFQDNTACDGVIITSNSRTNFSGDVLFRNNVGTLYADAAIIKFKGTFEFKNNSPLNLRCGENIDKGGAVTFFLTTVVFSGPSATFIGNRAINGGAMYLAYSQVYVSSEMSIVRNTAEIKGGGIFLYQSYLSVFSNVTITDNKADYGGGGIYASDTSLVVTSSDQSTFHYLQVDHNKANLGGGLFFSSSTRLFMYHLEPRPHNISTVLVSNEAECGGAMYISDETYTVCNAEPSLVDSECFFRISDSYENTGRLQLIYQSNTANVSGSAIFGGLLDRCIVGPPSNLTSGISYLGQVSNLESRDHIASYPVQVCFCVDSLPNCDLLVMQVSAPKGKSISVSLVAIDQVGHALNATITFLLQSHTGGLAEGQLSQDSYGTCSDVSLSVTSTAEHEEIMLFPEGPCGDAELSRRTINVTFSKCVCPIGFDIDLKAASNCECKCSERINEFIKDCNISTESFRKTSNSWIAYENTSEYSGFIISHTCPYDYCLPIASVNLNLQNGADMQCANHRKGTLCGGCKFNFSLSVDQSGCVSCSSTWPLNVVLITLASLIIGVLMVGIILLFNLTVTTGTISGFIFFANILKALFPFPRNGYRTYLISLFNLEIPLNVCYYDGFDTYAKTWFELGYPVYLIFIVFLVITLCKYSSRFARFIGKRNPVETLATLIFLSYAKLLQFPIIAFSCDQLVYPNGSKRMIWLPDANITCFGVQHTIMFIVALIVTILVFAYTLLLLFWQWLVRCPDRKIFALIKNPKFQSLMEMYHIPYNEKHRYWTGLLLFIRIIVYLVAISFDFFGISLAIIILLSSLFVIKSVSMRVYKKWPVDMLESMLIVITIALAASASYAKSTDNEYAPNFVTWTSTILVGVLFIIVIACHIKKYILTNKVNFKVRRISRLTLKGHRTVSVKNDYVDNQGLNYLQPSIRDRNDSVLYVMDPPTECDYHELQVKQQLERLANEEHQEKLPTLPPTFSSLELPPSISRQI